MKKFFVMCLITTFLTTQYGYTRASCAFCEQSEEMFQFTGFARPELEEIESMFDKLGLSEKIELINLDETFTLEYKDAEITPLERKPRPSFLTGFTYVSLYDGNRYLFVEKEGSLIGAINQYEGKRNIILPQDIQPEWICELICFLVYGQSTFSIIACFLLPMVIISYPDDQELRDALYRSCLNGILGILWTLGCSYRFCF